MTIEKLVELFSDCWKIEDGTAPSDMVFIYKPHISLAILKNLIKWEEWREIYIELKLVNIMENEGCL